MQVRTQPTALDKSPCSEDSITAAALAQVELIETHVSIIERPNCLDVDVCRPKRSNCRMVSLIPCVAVPSCREASVNPRRAP